MGNTSRTLKNYTGVISPGVMTYFNIKYYNVSSYNAIGSADISSLKIYGAWNTALGAVELAGKTLGNCYNNGGILAVGTGQAATSYNDYTLNDITSLTHVAYNYGYVYRNSAGKWCGYVGRTLKNDTAADIS